MNTSSQTNNTYTSSIEEKTIMYTIGIDAGSRNTKFCLFDTKNHRVCYTQIQDTTNKHDAQLESFIKKIKIEKNINTEQIKDIITTGYGRKKYENTTRTSSEILCHARGTYFYNPEIATIIDIGGQDSKIIKTTKNARVMDFLMNDKCAAGTGRFLEKVAKFFEVEVISLGLMDDRADKDIEISSTCVVFAESEMIGLIAKGETKENIIKAIHNSIAHRILSMGINIEKPVAFVGGVAKNTGMVNAIKRYLNANIYIPPLPEFTGAIGAAMYTKKV